jgi:hypothetical protein
VDVGVSASGASWAHEGDRGAHRADGDGESRLGLQPHPGCVEESRPPRREKHCRQGAEGPRIPPVPGRPPSWRTFLRAYWGAIAGADFFTTVVWTPRGLVTYYTLFVLDLESRRVLVVGSTPNPDAGFMVQAARHLTDAVDGFLTGHRVLICDRDGKWTDGFRSLLEGAGYASCGRLSKRRTPTPTPSVRPLDPRGVSRPPDSLRRTTPTACARRVRGALPRNHQGLGNDLIAPAPHAVGRTGIRRRDRLGGLLRYYSQAA